MRGVTFIEIILVVALVAVMSVMAPVFYSRFLVQNSVTNVEDQLVGSLRKAQVYSMMGKSDDSWSVNFSSGTIFLYKGTDFINRNQSFDEKFSVSSNITISPFSDIQFFRGSGVSNQGLVTINISGNNTSRAITINNQGVVSR